MTAIVDAKTNITETVLTDELADSDVAGSLRRLGARRTGGHRDIPGPTEAEGIAETNLTVTHLTDDTRCTGSTAYNEERGRRGPTAFPIGFCDTEPEPGPPATTGQWNGVSGVWLPDGSTAPADAAEANTWAVAPDPPFPWQSLNPQGSIEAQNETIRWNGSQWEAAPDLPPAPDPDGPTFTVTPNPLQLTGSPVQITLTVPPGTWVEGQNIQWVPSGTYEDPSAINLNPVTQEQAETGIIVVDTGFLGWGPEMAGVYAESWMYQTDWTTWAVSTQLAPSFTVLAP